jgi:hypothetical protein
MKMSAMILRFPHLRDHARCLREFEQRLEVIVAHINLEEDIRRDFEMAITDPRNYPDY